MHGSDRFHLSDEDHGETSDSGSVSSLEEPRTGPAEATVRSSRRGAAGPSAAGPHEPVIPWPRIGARLDAFELQEAIGVGGMGAVFRALDTQLDRQVALKILPPEQAHDLEVVQRFYQEGRAAARLDHENIARVFTIGHDGQYHYIAFEFIEGTTLRQQVEHGGPLAPAEAINYTLQIANALIHAAERGVVHRDIKPSNIIVTPQGRAKLVDMGLARRFERTDDDGLTQSNMTLGTFDYISPEQARDPRDVDVRSDLYSLGCTLFHMLTGRPPFPEGTVLQKLLQHQEEPPPDVQALNPDVPTELAVILRKLMAKDRDRRYQTPEQLVRDLLTLAGALGLRSLSPEGLVWLSASPTPAWERHLVWGIPALTLIAVVAALIWWGRDTSPSGPFDADPLLPQAPALSSAEPSPSPPVLEAPNASAARELGAAADRTASDTPRTRSILSVGSEEDLRAVLATAPSRATIVLTDRGPYDLRPSADEANAPLRLVDRDLTIKAETGQRAVLRLSPSASPSSRRDPHGAPAGAAIRFEYGRILLESLEIQIDSGDEEDLQAALVAVDSDITIRRCLFRPQGSRPRRGRLAAVAIQASDAEGLRTAPVILDTCHFQGGLIGVLATGLVDLSLRDCTFGATEPALWLDRAGRPDQPADVRVQNVSILAGSGPVFRFTETEARLRVDDTVVAPPSDGQATLVFADDADRLDWLGRNNLYAKVRTYLQAPSDRDTIREFAVWENGGGRPREFGAQLSQAHIWDAVDPLAALRRDDPTPAFRLRRIWATSHAGARRGLGDVAVASSREEGLASVREESLTVASNTLASEPEPLRTRTAETPVSPRPRPSEPPRATEPEAPPPMIRMGDVPMPEEEPLPSPMGFSPMDEPPPPRPEAVRPMEPDAEASPDDGGDGLIRTARQLQEALDDAEPEGGTLLLAPDAELVLPPIDLPDTGRWIIQAATATDRRPRMRFRPPESSETAAARRLALFHLGGGALELRGVDLVLSASDPLIAGRQAAFLLDAGSELRLNQCTLTIEGDQGRSAAILVPSAVSGRARGPAALDPAIATVRVTDSLLRVGGDLVQVAADRRLTLQLDNTVVATSGALVHGFGLARGQTPQNVHLTINQTTAWAAGGVIFLESSPGEPMLPQVEAVARDAILATMSPETPLIRVDGQDSLESLADRIRWDETAVAYHKIETYRQDHTAQVGRLPNRYDRQAWDLAIGARAGTSIHDDLRFATDWDPRRPLWTLERDDVRLSRASPARTTGPDLDTIPAPPPLISSLSRR